MTRKPVTGRAIWVRNLHSGLTALVESSARVLAAKLRTLTCEATERVGAFLVRVGCEKKGRKGRGGWET